MHTISNEQQQVTLNTMQTTSQIIENHLNIQLHAIAENRTSDKVSNTNGDVDMYLK